MFSEINWIKENKICPSLSKELVQIYRQHKWVPAFLSKPLMSLKNSLRKVNVIVQLDANHWLTALNTDNLAGTLGCQVNQKLDLIGGFSTRVNIKTLRKMADHHGIKKIWSDREVRAFLDVACPVVNAPPVWRRGLRGKGIGMAVLDTGIYPHPDLVSPVNRITAFKDFIGGRIQPYDDNGHGTHCAGDAAGNGYKSGGKYRGAAPGANVIGIKVLNKQGSGYMSNVIAGIQWCVDNKVKYGIRVLSISLGAAANTSYKNDPLCLAVEKAWNSGIVVCVAAGNEGPDAGTISTPGIDPRVITVGALNDKNTVAKSDDAIASFSSRGPTVDGLTKPDVVAPGVNIVSLRSPNSYIDKISRQARVGNSYITLSGTSMATPICAGLAALILEACPALTPNEVKNILKSTCRTINPNPNAQGAGLIDAWSARNRCRGS